MKDVKKPGARETALEVLMQVDRANAWSDGSLKRTIAKNQLDSRDAALATRLSNAVLRKFVANWMNMPALPGTTLDYLSIRYSHPKWLVKRLLELLGPEEAESYLRMNNEIVPTTVQTNLLKTTPEALEEELRRSGAAVEKHPWLTGCFEVSATGDLESFPAFAEGHFMVQDAAARLVATVAQPEPTAKVLDVCAAPGGKSFALAIDMGDQGQIVSCDIHPHKLQLVEKSAQRLGITSIRVAQADGREHHAAWQQTADLVVADVPCSGLGIIRKKPDIRYKNPKELTQLPSIQKAILENAATYVRPGGTLIYSTCTVLPEENEAVTEDFLARHIDFTLESFQLPLPIGHSKGHLTLWPQRYGTDGFYICRMRRK